MATILIAGCGDVGNALGRRLMTDGHTVYGLRRNVAQLAHGIQPIAASLNELADVELPQVDYLVYCAAAKSSDEAVYRGVYLDGLRCMLERLADQNVKRLIFTSSTSVYAQNNGDWVDELSNTTPSSFSGQVMLEAETLVQEATIPGICLRLGGIYGPSRNYLLKAIQQGASYPTEPPIYGNRIHRDDCAGLLAHLLFVDNPKNTYIGVDNEPAPMHEVANWLRDALKASGLPLGTASNTPPRRASKRCNNQRARDSGYVFHYPSYREGYAPQIHMLQS